VKPENVLITDDGRVKVADFGLARAVATSNQTTATSGVLIGTVSYLAPELVLDGTADPRSDVYSCGVLLYEMLTGQKPHQGESPIQVAYRHVHEDVPAPSALQHGVPEYLDALVARATARNKDARFADAKVLLHQVRRVRSALDDGVRQDDELTADLQPSERLAALDATDIRLPATVALTDDDGREHTHTLHTGAASTEVSADETPPTHQQVRRSRKGLVALLVVLALAIGAGVGGWYYGIGRFTETPDLTGMTLQQAKSELDDTDLRLSSTQGFSETVPAGEIISTDPDAGDRILDSGTIAAVVSKGKERYNMPEVVGLDEQAAAERLTDRNLAVGEISREFSEDVDKGVVMRAGHDPGAKLRRDTEVDLVISKGRRPIDVPDLVGTPQEEAVGALEDAGLAPAVEQAFHNEVPKGHVISQEPADGTLFKGDAVNLVVSSGPEMVQVPSVFGRSEAEATQLLESAGFAVDVQRADAYVGFDRIAAQDPGARSEAPKGSTVTIYLY
jgi:eukaryotic-like serine/threonine-protein kinase